MTTSSTLLADMSDHEQVGRLLTLALKFAKIGKEPLYKALVERLLTDPAFEESFSENLMGHGLVMIGRSMEHGVALAQGNDQKSLFCANRADFTDGRVMSEKLRRLGYVRLSSVVAVCAAAFPKSAEGGGRDLVTFTIDDVVALIRKAASDVVVNENSVPGDMPEPAEIIASVIQDMPTDDRYTGAIDSVRANVTATIQKLVKMEYLSQRPPNADGVVDYSAQWKLVKLVEYFGDRTLVSTLRSAA